MSHGGDPPAGVGTATAIVPFAVGPLVRLGGGADDRRSDDLDQLIDELLPEVDDRPGWFDVALLVGGAGLVAWRLVAHGPRWALAAGLFALVIGIVLPVRSAWRGGQRRRHDRRRQGTLATGLPLDLSAPSVSALVQAYERLLPLTGDGEAGVPTLAAAHAAMLDAASLLDGRPPASPQERDYVEQRTDAIVELAAELDRRSPAADLAAAGGDRPAQAHVVEAREELDRISGTNTVARLRTITDELRNRPDGHS